MSANSLPHIQEAIQVAEHSVLLKQWLSHVAMMPDRFEVNLIHRSSIESALVLPSQQHPSLNAHYLAPFLWLENCVARRSHQDNI
jgi:hypothetical protein